MLQGIEWNIETSVLHKIGGTFRDCGVEYKYNPNCFVIQNWLGVSKMKSVIGFDRIVGHLSRHFLAPRTVSIRNWKALFCFAGHFVPLFMLKQFFFLWYRFGYGFWIPNINSWFLCRLTWMHEYADQQWMHCSQQTCEISLLPRWPINRTTCSLGLYRGPYFLQILQMLLDPSNHSSMNVGFDISDTVLGIKLTPVLSQVCADSFRPQCQIFDNWKEISYQRKLLAIMVKRRKFNYRWRGFQIPVSLL